jgi:hypothetical protein
VALARLKSVAGVTLPDTALCNAAVDLLESSSPEFLCTHCLRTYIFGSLAVRGLGQLAIDEEAAFCAAVLHDLGLVKPYRRDSRFEVNGANAPREFCSKHQVPPERRSSSGAIALHTSVGIATRMSDEMALVHLGAGLELFGLGPDQFRPQVVVEEIFGSYPRMNFTAQFRNLLVEHCRHNPAVQVLTWTDDLRGERAALCTISQSRQRHS